MREIIIFLVLITVLVATGCTSNTDDHDHDANMMHGHDEHMMHGERNATEPYPTINVTAQKDPKVGWNIRIQTTNFNWSPQRASLDHVDGEGHAHLYINDVKQTRLYGEWFHIPELNRGKHKIMVTLNSNSHEDYIVEGKKVSDFTYIVVE